MFFKPHSTHDNKQLEVEGRNVQRPADPDEPQKPKGRLEKIDKIGEGSLGVINLAFYEDRLVVVKTLTKKNLIDLFKAEVAALKRCDSLFIVKALPDVPAAKNELVLEWVDGCDLSQYVLNTQKKLTATMAQKLAREISQGLAYLHELGIVHGDLKQENVLVPKKGAAKLCDLNLSASTDDKAYSANVKQKWVSYGLMYRPPEVLHGRLYRASDLFAFGVIAYDLDRAGYEKLSDTAEAQYFDDKRFDHKGYYTELRNKAQGLVDKPMRFSNAVAALVQLCWSKHPDKRPKANEIASICAEESSPTTGTRPAL